MLKTKSYRILLILLITTLPVLMDTGNVVASDHLEYEDNVIYMRLVIRNADQLASFYHGREFPQNAIDEIQKTCFITPIVKNKAFDALWVEPDSWNFIMNGKTIKRIKRDYWKDIWKKIDLPLAHQATFGWTLMPETRDLRLDEGVGGSVVIPKQAKPFTLKAHFNTGFKKKGEPEVVVFKDISCSN